MDVILFEQATTFSNSGKNVARATQPTLIPTTKYGKEFGPCTPSPGIKFCFGEWPTMPFLSEVL
jgi:hypothetical protein